VGFIDGTKIAFARPPGVMQRATYSGHKRVNCLKYQLISAPDGLALHYAGAVEGRRHDMAIFSESGIKEDLAASLRIDRIQYCIYGDSVYVLRVYFMVRFDGTGITPEQAAFNKAKSRSRVTVEWIFKDIKKILEPRCIPAQSCVVQNSCWGFVRNQHYSLELPLPLVRIAYLTLLLVSTSNSKSLPQPFGRPTK
jgi:hypothetical protein